MQLRPEFCVFKKYEIAKPVKKKPYFAEKYLSLSEKSDSLCSLMLAQNMKNLLRVVLLTVFSSSLSLAQIAVPPANSNLFKNLIAKRQVASEYSSGVESKSYSVPSDPLSTLVSVPGANWTKVRGLFDLQTNGRGLHNIQVDPSNPLNIHICVMTTTSTDPSDTSGGAYPSRRVMYSFSSDGGTTWKTPVSVAAERTGYPDMILYKRGKSYVPIIAAHRYAPGSTTNFESAIFLEQGNPGDGNFKEFDCDRAASDGATKDLLWPSIALSNDQSKVYIIGDFSNQTNATLMDYMEFGSFSLSTDGKTATWNHWTAQPGGGDGTKGWSSSGKHVIRVGQDGRIGVLWINPDGGDGDHNMYLAESKDGGVTWPTSIPPAIPALQDQNGTRAIAPDNGLDFFYQGNTPNFIWQADEINYNETDSNSYYYPYTGQIFFWNPTVKNLQCINYNDNQGLVINNAIVMGTDTATANYLYQNTNFLNANIPTGIGFPHFACVDLPTFALTSNPNVFAVFYEAISDYDTANVVDRAGNTHLDWYSNIYFQYTLDGGMTWTTPAPYKSNQSESVRLDYRYPEASTFNPVISKLSQLQIMFAADSLAGFFEETSNDGAGYDFTYWFYQSYALNSVRMTGNIAEDISLSQNYPNPFIASTTIPVVMKNDDMVTISVADILGREVAVVYHGRLTAGEHQIPFSATNLGAGIYTYTLKTSSGSISRTMSLVK